MSGCHLCCVVAGCMSICVERVSRAGMPSRGCLTGLVQGLVLPSAPLFVRVCLFWFLQWANLVCPCGPSYCVRLPLQEVRRKLTRCTPACACAASAGSSVSLLAASGADHLRHRQPEAGCGRRPRVGLGLCLQCRAHHGVSPSCRARHSVHNMLCPARHVVPVTA